MNSTLPFQREARPAQFCNLDRLLHAMEQRGIDGLVATTALNVFYLSGFAGIAHKSDEPRPYAVVISRHAPDHPILLLADYYVSSVIAQPSWIEDVRSFRAVMMPLDIDARPDDIDRFVPSGKQAWAKSLQKNHTTSLGEACKRALADLGLSTATVAFDDLRVGYQLNESALTVADGYDSLMAARSIKTPYEIEKLKTATKLNEQAILNTINSWDKGMRWREFNLNYQKSVAALGGFVRDPGGMVWGHARGADEAIMLESGFNDTEITTGTNVLFDCHGTLDMYCWDGGKTWIVDADPTTSQKKNLEATANVAETVLASMKPGAKISELQAIGREGFRKSGVSDPDRGLVFFHGLGLSHMDIEQAKADGGSNADWVLEKDMVVPLHILYPGDENHRSWVEEIAHVTEAGGNAFFSWGFDPIVGA